MIKRIDLLINYIKQRSDTFDDNSLNRYVIEDYLNDAQRTIQNVIFQADHSNNMFVGRYFIEPNNSNLEFQLPSDVYANRSIIDVHSITAATNRIVRKYGKNGFNEQAYVYGYSIENSCIILNHYPSERILVRYNKRLPILSTRLSEVTAINGQDITTVDLGDNTDFQKYYEYLTIVDKKGSVLAQDLLIGALNVNTLTVEGDIAGLDLSNGAYLVGGAYASSHCLLPVECENYLKIFVERKMLAHINSKKVRNQDIFTKEEREDLIDLFEDVDSDIETPYIVDTDYLDI